MNNTLIIIPSYNESDNIATLIKSLFSVKPDCDILVVDDSSDNTAAIVKDLQTSLHNLYLIARKGKGGRGSAVLDGFDFALERQYQNIVEMDADFSHDPHELPLLLAHTDKNTVVIGSRYVSGSRIVNWPRRRRVFSFLANLYATVILRIGIHDYTNGYRVYAGEALNKLHREKIRGSGYIVLSEISYQLFQNGVHFVEVPITFVNRSRGASNFSWKEIREAFLSVLRIRFQSLR